MTNFLKYSLVLNQEQRNLVTYNFKINNGLDVDVKISNDLIEKYVDVSNAVTNLISKKIEIVKIENVDESTLKSIMEDTRKEIAFLFDKKFDLILNYNIQVKKIEDNRPQYIGFQWGAILENLKLVYTKDNRIYISKIQLNGNEDFVDRARIKMINSFIKTFNKDTTYNYNKSFLSLFTVFQSFVKQHLLGASVWY